MDRLNKTNLLLASNETSKGLLPAPHVAPLHAFTLLLRQKPSPRYKKMAALNTKAVRITYLKTMT